ncbi:hypothetical protein WG904_08255 [Pedobacter sp. Du54]|uniref:hypothetical protein n=1 Tax=Pedobacter anseongensis TaxID=3133439 RepID=UPI0030B247E5
MKNQSITTALRKGIVNLLIIGTSLMVMSFRNIGPTPNTYQIISSKISIEGTGKFSQMKLNAGNCNVEGQFSTDSDLLEDIKDLRFSIPIDQINARTQQDAEMIKTLFKNKNCNEITFNQKSLMVLPIMKMVHMIGEIKIGNEKHAVPMQMQYLANEDGSITLYGRQFVKLSEFGIILPNTKPTDVEEEITINISIQLNKPLPNFAKLIIPTFLQKESGNNL